jgi:4'-phosphopantetheinyl transferase
MPVSPLDVSLWIWALDVEPTRQAQLAEWLSPDERARAARFATDRLRGRWTVARAGMRSVLGAEVGLSPETLQFAYNANGKPTLADWREGASFNLSHSHGLAALAMCEATVGADIERLGAVHEDVAQRFFSPVEAAVVQSTPEADRAATFYRFWTAKEAFLKALGTGFTQAPAIALRLAMPSRGRPAWLKPRGWKGRRKTGRLNISRPCQTSWERSPYAPPVDS